ncbi:MAG: hypothetical protein ACJ71W_23005 [Terriglobales bacterium]|jgi:hypothetical protein
MAKIMSRMMKRDERGMALMLALFALLLLSGIGLCMVLSSNTETRIDSNYGGNLRSYYAAHSGLEEVRDRISYPSTSPIFPNGLADKLPTNIAGNSNGVLYVINPKAGETVDPTDPTSPYFDVQLCHDYNSGVTIRDSRCSAVPSTANWMALQNAAPAATPTGLPLGYKWVRINVKTNRIAAPYFVDQKGDPTTLDTRVCWDGETEQLSPGGASPQCDANGMQPVYMLTSLATAQGTRNLLRAEVVGSSIRPPAAVTVEVGSSTSSTPISAAFILPATSPTSSNDTLVPAISIDGGVHAVAGAPSTACSPVAALASNTPQGTTSLQTGLNNLRSALVDHANNFCNADGSSVSASNRCTPLLAWVRGTGALPQFTTAPPTTVQAPAATPTPTPIPAPTPTSTSTSSNNSGKGNDDHKNPTPTPTPTPTPVPTPTPTPTGDCSTATQSCYTNLDLSLLTLNLPPLFAGNPGNSGDAAVYQSQTPTIVADENQAVLDYIDARKASGSNYFELASTSLDPKQAYGSLAQPAVLIITDSSLKLSTNLTGFGILQVPNDFEMNSTSNLQWTGIVMVRSSSSSPSGQFLISSGATGSINGALMLQATTQFVLTNSNTNAGGTPAFTVSYSCQAIDAAMGNRPLKVVSHTETSY